MGSRKLLNGIAIHMSETFIRLCVPWTSDDEMDSIKEVITSGYLTQGPKTEEFERAVAEYVGAQYAFATSSCTTALHLSLVALGVGPGDNVLVPDFTFPATANVVIQQGARPILVDVDPGTFNIDIEDLFRKWTPRTKAVIPVHVFGRPASMDQIREFAQGKNLAVIEDAACALGATYKGKRCGNLGDLGCFSFHPRKIVMTGEGGMITTNSNGLAKKIAVLRSHGSVREASRLRFVAAGFNYRMSDVNAAIGIVQMRKLSEIVRMRRQLAEQYMKLLSEISGLTLPVDEKHSIQTYQSFVVMLPKRINRDEIIMKMKESGVETTIGTYALHTEPYFQKYFGYKSGDLPVSFQCARRSLTLPLYPQMTVEDLSYVIEAFQKALG